MRAQELDSEEKLKIVVDASEDKKANYVSTLDLRGKTLIADFFVICSGTSNIHIRAIADGIMEALEKLGHRQKALEGYSEASWILLDYGDVIAHIMSEEQRDFYKLERLWTSTQSPEPATAVDKLAGQTDTETKEDGTE
jgi:ribosome-associated protein